MFGYPKKWSRLGSWTQQSRAARQGNAQARWQQRRSVFLRLGVGIVAVALTSLIVQFGGGSWGPPLAFRKGETYPRDIRAKVDFRVVDDNLTVALRERAAQRVHPVLRLDPQPLQEVSFRLKELCRAALRGTTTEDDQAMLAYWSLTVDEFQSLAVLLRGTFRKAALVPQAVPPPVPLVDAWLARPMQVIAAAQTSAPVRGEDDLLRMIELAFAGVSKLGILDDHDGKLPEPVADAVRRGESLTIVSTSTAAKPVDVLPQQVLMSKVVGDPSGPRGSLYLQFVNAFKDERLAERLYTLVAGTMNRSGRLPGTLEYDRQRTEHAKDLAKSKVPVQEKRFARGDLLVPQGRPITERDMVLLRAEHQALLSQLTFRDHLRRWLALVAIGALLATFIALYIQRFLPGLVQSLPRLLGFCALAVVALAAAVVLHQEPWFAAVVPLTMCAMILAIAFDQPFALVTSFSLALLTTLALGTSVVQHFLVLVSGLAVAVLLLRQVRNRVQLAKVGLAAGVAYAVMTVAVGAFTDQSWQLIGQDAVRRFFWGVVAGLLLGGLMPLVERAFGVVTDMSLQELADVGHELLQDLVRRAPGTYTHSMTVATLAEAAAKEIGANALLTRVGAYFHDIGKMLKPHYFVENQSGENRHQGLAPAMSTLIIIGHVKDGVELGKQHRLPKVIIDFIEQHHGTTLIEYFYREAAKGLNSHQANGELESAFRYPGPKPQTREIAVVMIADAAEGASRALDEPSPSSIKKLVSDIVMKRLLDGQFDECGMTLSELNTVEESLSKNLVALFHARVKYPEAKAEAKSAS